MKRLWRDTLFKRLFILMWVALVASHFVAYMVVTRGGAAGPGAQGGFSLLNAPVFPSLPPTPGLPDGGPVQRGGPMPPVGEDMRPRPPPGDPSMGDAGPPGPDTAGEGVGEPPRHSGLPTSALLLDYGVRFLMIGLAAWWGARWLSAPVRRLVDASHELASSIGGNAPPPRLDEARGTLEVREAARVFNDMARQLDEQFKGRGLLVAAISHDLRTPLTRMRMRLESIDAELAQRCIADVREMDALIDSSLTLFRGASSAEPTHPVDVLSLVQSLCDDLAEQGQAVTAGGHASTVVDAQPMALRRVVSNLISNAVRYGQRADVMVLREPGLVKIIVDDAGPGIPAAQMEAVFQAFYRVEGSRNRGSGGTGLGLYIARDLIVRQGGTLALANRPEGGLRATVTMPIRRES